MNKLFLDYNLSLEMKEIGFDQECFTWYWDDIGLYNGLNFGNHNNKTNYVSAVLYQQAIDFFRDKHGICISVYPDASGNSNNYWFEIYIDFVQSPKYGSWQSDYYSALTQAIKESINIVKNQKQ